MAIELWFSSRHILISFLCAVSATSLVVGLNSSGIPFCHQQTQGDLKKVYE